jgi:hypothetical protein
MWIFDLPENIEKGRSQCQKKRRKNEVFVIEKYSITKDIILRLTFVLYICVHYMVYYTNAAILKVN